MKLRWITGILMAGVLALSAMAQADQQQLPNTGGGTATEPSPDSAVTPDLTPQPQDSLNAYEQQMAVVTVQTYTELVQIAEGLQSGQISNERAEYLTRRCFEVGVVRLQFLDTMHLIAESKLPEKLRLKNLKSRHAKWRHLARRSLCRRQPSLPKFRNQWSSLLN